jgi:hypothetical protein
VLDAFGLKGRLFASDVIDYVLVVEDDHVSPQEHRLNPKFGQREKLDRHPE